MYKTLILFILIPLCSFSQTIISKEEISKDLIYPEKNVGLTYWNIVNDDVMGGISKSYLSINEENNL